MTAREYNKIVKMCYENTCSMCGIVDMCEIIRNTTGDSPIYYYSQLEERQKIAINNLNMEEIK